jgi:hypothetical protein
MSCSPAIIGIPPAQLRFVTSLRAASAFSKNRGCCSQRKGLELADHLGGCTLTTHLLGSVAEIVTRGLKCTLESLPLYPQLVVSVTIKVVRASEPVV